MDLIFSEANNFPTSTKIISTKHYLINLQPLISSSSGKECELGCRGSDVTFSERNPRVCIKKQHSNY